MASCPDGRPALSKAAATPDVSHDAYFASVAEDVRPRLAAIQAQVESLLPQATRCIGYRMPAYRGRRRIFFYFAAFKKHIGIYPPLRHDAPLIAELAPYRGEKGNLSFPLNQPLPIELIGRVAVALHREIDSA
ncbi:MAG TPA: DUF1801 domain-containing protein [Burkholderiaceae bacterium]|nr:DUF1801 domain-containing protein [Burkholderiaceae bacterium]HMY99180.1 DUF1801 domain-containing protein [Burkholderiaceae bacterium]HNB42729.1 DUF1801 domain-containing protein [Burkholderiaceae bacterium]HNG79777.1 DUF1801 domain-containing protein [Burkholderiaceae bacterium]